MYAFLNKYGQALAFGIGVLVVIIFAISIASTPAAEIASLTDDSLVGDAKLARYNTSAFDFGLVASIGLTILAFIAAIIFGVVQLASNPKGSLKGIIGFVALVAICLVCYAVANDDLSQETAAIQNSINKFNTDQGADFDGGTLKFVSGSIIATLVMIALSVVSLVVFGVRGIFK